MVLSTQDLMLNVLLTVLGKVDSGGGIFYVSQIYLRELANLDFGVCFVCSINFLSCFLRLLDEIDTVIGDKEELLYEDITKLEYMMLVSTLVHDAGKYFQVKSSTTIIFL